MKYPKVQILISSIVLIGIVWGLYLIRKDSDGITERYSKGTLRDLYRDSLQNEIKIVDYYLRSNHIILENDFEYFLDINKVSGVGTANGVLMDWVNSGGSIFKEANTNYLSIKCEDSKVVNIHFFTN